MVTEGLEVLAPRLCMRHLWDLEQWSTPLAFQGMHTHTLHAPPCGTYDYILSVYFCVYPHCSELYETRNCIYFIVFYCILVPSLLILNE